MEQNYQQEPKVNGKSVYLLHLDGPRILILSAIVIGLLSVAFLVGMKLVGDDKTENISAQNDSILEQPGTMPSIDAIDPLKAPVNDLQPQQNLSPQQAQIPVQDSVIPQSSTFAQQPAKKNEMDALSTGTPEIIQSTKKSSDKKLVKNKKSSTDAKSAKKVKAVDKADKKTVVEVFDSKPKNEKNDKRIVHGFFVQIASFDKVEKAKKEVQKLKELSFDAQYDKKEIKGKDFFRVRIGPISSKEKAVETLDEIQENSIYEDSFMIHE